MKDKEISYNGLHFIGLEWYERLQWDKQDVENQNPFHYCSPYESPPMEKWESDHCPACPTLISSKRISGPYNNRVCLECGFKWSPRQLERDSVT